MLAAALAAGCAGSPDRYYTLATPQAATVQQSAGSAPIHVELAPVAVPERLARPQLVVQVGRGSPELALLEKHRWSASFEQELRDALADGVAARLGGVDLTRGGRQTGVPVWRVAVQVRQFDMVQGEGVSAAFSWTARQADTAAGTPCRWAASRATTGNVAALAAEARSVTAGLADAISRHLQAMQARAGADCPG